MNAKRRDLKPLKRTDAQLDALAEVKPEDIEAAAVMWRKHAPGWAKALLDAEEEEDGRLSDG